MRDSRAGLRVVQGGVEALAGDSPDPDRFQADCVEAYVASWVARGYSQVTVDGSTTRLERVLATLGKPAWEVTAEDVDEVVGTWAGLGIAASTRRTYVQAFKGFHEFLVARKAVEIGARFGVRLQSPLDEFNAARHVANDSPATLAPPSRPSLPAQRPKWRGVGRCRRCDTPLRRLRSTGPAARSRPLQPLPPPRQSAPGMWGLRGAPRHRRTRSV